MDGRVVREAVRFPCAESLARRVAGSLREALKISDVLAGFDRRRPSYNPHGYRGERALERGTRAGARPRPVRARRRPVTGALSSQAPYGLSVPIVFDVHVRGLNRSDWPLYLVGLKDMRPGVNKYLQILSNDSNRGRRDLGGINAFSSLPCSTTGCSPARTTTNRGGCGLTA